MANIELLLSQLGTGEVPERIRAADGLASCHGDRRVIPALRAALCDRDDTAVTEAAMDALLKIGTAEAADALVDSLNNDDEETAGHLALFLQWAGEHGSSIADQVLGRHRAA